MQRMMTNSAHSQWSLPRFRVGSSCSGICGATNLVFRRESLALPIWEQVYQREARLGEPRRWRTLPHVPPQNGFPHRPANARQPEMVSVSNKSGKYKQVEVQHAV